MNTFETIQQKILGLTFILAPLLMAVGAAAQGLGIGETPSGNFSTAEGIFTGYGYLLMIPVVFKLAQILGRRAPILGTICLILGLGWGASMVPAAAPVLQTGLLELGISDSISDLFTASQGEMMSFLLPSISSVFGFFILSLGLLWKGGIPRWAAGLLILGTVLFLIGISGEEGHIWQATLPAFICFLIALAPIGIQQILGIQPVEEFEMAAA